MKNIFRYYSKIRRVQLFFVYISEYILTNKNNYFILRYTVYNNIIDNLIEFLQILLNPKWSL